MEDNVVVDSRLLWALACAVGFAGWFILTHPNQQYSTEEYWQTATLQDVADVPQEALEPRNINGPVLMWAASSTIDPRIITALVKRGADVNGDDFSTYKTSTRRRGFNSSQTKVDENIQASPLSAAAAQSTSPAVIAELIRLGAVIDSRHTNDFTPLMIAASWNSNPKITQELIKHGADISLKNKFGQTALESAKATGNHRVVAVLEKQFAELGFY